jgi:Peptidase family M23
MTKIEWQVPVNGPVSGSFGESRARTAPHMGVDIAVPQGTQVDAAAGGTVVRASTNSGYGNVVIIDHGSDNGAFAYSLYAHLKEMWVDVGQEIPAGTPIGTSGQEGSGSTGPHLHFEIIEAPHALPWSSSGATGVPGTAFRVDPTNLIPGLGTTPARSVPVEEDDAPDERPPNSTSSDEDDAVPPLQGASSDSGPSAADAPEEQAPNHGGTDGSSQGEDGSIEAPAPATGADIDWDGSDSTNVPEQTSNPAEGGGDKSGSAPENDDDESVESPSPVG